MVAVKHLPHRRHRRPLLMPKRTTVRAMPAAKQHAMAEANVAAAMDAEADVAAMSVATVQTDVQMALPLTAHWTAHSAATKLAITKLEIPRPATTRSAIPTPAIPRPAALSRVLSSAVNNVLTQDPIIESSVMHARRVSRVKAVVKTAHAASAVSAPTEAAREVVREVVIGGVIAAVTEATSSAHQWTRLSKTLPWPTRPRWQLPWAARRSTLDMMRHAASVVSVVAAATAAATPAARGVTISRALTPLRARTRPHR